MILAETEEGIRFVTQPDHAALAGRLAERWGGGRFAPPEPTAAVRLAVHAHDDGWWAHDRRPRLDADGSPQAFHELSASRWTRLYRSGIDDVVGADDYAGLLVSLHGSGLRRRRYGLSPSWGDTPRAFRDFVAREERRQRSLATTMDESDDDERISAADVSLLQAIHEDERVGEQLAAESRLWMNYRLLSALDGLSLRICSTVVPADPSMDSTAGSETDAAAGSETDATAETDPISIARVPTDAGEPDTTLTAEPIGPGTYRLAPYPFVESPVAVRVPTRTVDRTTFEDEAALLEQYYEADIEEMTVTFREGEADGGGL